MNVRHESTVIISIFNLNFNGQLLFCTTFYIEERDVTDFELWFHLRILH